MWRNKLLRDALALECAEIQLAALLSRGVRKLSARVIPGRERRANELAFSLQTRYYGRNLGQAKRRIWLYLQHPQSHACGRLPTAAGPEQAVLSFYTPFHSPGLDPTTQVTLGRAELLSAPYSEYETRIYRQRMRVFGTVGFDPTVDVAGVILNPWGHAYSIPYPGFYGGVNGLAPRDTLRKNYERIAFAHSELDGLQHYGPAAHEGRRAYEQLADAL